MQKHYQRFLRNVKKNENKSMYHRTAIQTQFFHTHHQEILIRPRIEIINAEGVIINKKYQLLTAVYKPKVQKFKLDEDPLHRRIYFLTFMESLKKIRSTRRLVRYLNIIQL